MPRMYCSHVAYCTTLRCSNSHHQSSPQRDPGRGGAKPYFWTFQLSPLVVSPEILVAKGGNDRWILPEMPDFHVAFRDLLHAVNLRNGTDGFGRAWTANLGTKGQHAASSSPTVLLLNLTLQWRWQFWRNNVTLLVKVVGVTLIKMISTKITVLVCRLVVRQVRHKIPRDRNWKRKR
jgi:hypothetical protein